jgi:hypothetical protein
VKNLLSIAAIVSLLCASAWATTIRPMSLKELTRTSSTVAVAQAVKVWSQWSDDHRLIYTYTEFSIEQSLKGDPGTRLVVRQLGGRVGDLEMKVAGVQHWRPGEETVLFLNKSKSGDGTYLVTGLLQGDFRISRRLSGEAMVTNPVGTGVETFDPTTHRMGEFTPARMTLSQLQTLVQRYRVQP